MQTLSDITILSDPNTAAKWFLDFGNTIQSILRIGDRTTSLGMECFNDINLCRVCKCLPYTLRHKAYYLEERGRERLVKIIDMVTKERNNVERKARDEYSLRLYDSPTVTSNSDITQEVLDTTDSLTQTPQSSASMHDSWSLLCLGTGRRFPTTEDINRSTIYAKTPKSFRTEPGFKTNSDCRIFKVLQSSGTHRDKL